jgi:hypothetical protein
MVDVVASAAAPHPERRHRGTIAEGQALGRPVRGEPERPRGVRGAQIGPPSPSRLSSDRIKCAYTIIDATRKPLNPKSTSYIQPPRGGGHHHLRQPLQTPYRETRGCQDSLSFSEGQGAGGSCELTASNPASRQTVESSAVSVLPRGRFFWSRIRVPKPWKPYTPRDFSERGLTLARRMNRPAPYPLRCWRWRQRSEQVCASRRRGVNASPHAEQVRSVWVTRRRRFRYSRWHSREQTASGWWKLTGVPQTTQVDVPNPT